MRLASRCRTRTDFRASFHARVLDASGAAVSVREALALINETLDEVLAEQEGDFDADTRWALAWFDQSGFSDGEYGVAETLSTAKNTSVAGMVEAGILTSGAGKVRLLAPAELPQDWDPKADSRRTVWETTHHLVRVHSQGGDSAAADIMANLGADAETARDLAYRLYRICDLRNRPQEALGYNAWSAAGEKSPAWQLRRSKPRQSRICSMGSNSWQTPTMNESGRPLTC